MPRSPRSETSRKPRRPRQTSSARPARQRPHARRPRFEPLEDRRLLAALVGVDFGTGSTPVNWTPMSSVGATASPTMLTNIIDETGAATAIDLTISTTFSGGATSTIANIAPTTLPQHTQSLAQVSGVVFVDSADGVHRFDAKFGDLKPGFSYEVYVFGLESAVDGTPFVDNQTVTISGGGSPIVFPQNPITGGSLWVNDQVGSSVQQLANYRKLMTPTAAGQIDVKVQMNAGSDALVLAGLAIREVGIIVNNTGDVDDMNAANGVTTLREAIRLANASAGADTITFDPTSMSGQTITLGGTELAITEALTIDAAPLAQNVTINAQQLSRIFNITTTSGDFTLTGLTLTGGRTTAFNNPGAAISSSTFGLLTLFQCTVSGNSTIGDSAIGGGIFADGNLTLTQSTVSGNSTTGPNARGGGIHANGNITLSQSTVSGNSTTGQSSVGGGISTSGNITLSQSTVSGNSTTGQATNGGGIFSSASVTLTQSTFSGNSTAGSGGGVWQNNLFDDPPVVISGSILAGNTATGGSPDLRSSPQSVVTVNYSLIGDASGSGVSGGTGNLLNVNPLLGPLADNGGPTKTQALLPGSPALDAGDLGAAAGLDQRGFNRLVDGDGVAGARIDIGAYEAQVKPSADFDSNTVVDGFDFLRWQRGLGTPGATRSQGNSDGDADTDHSDLAAWRVHFGATGVTSEAASLSAATPAAASAVTAPATSSLDAAFAAGDFTALFAARPAFRPPSKARIRR